MGATASPECPCSPPRAGFDVGPILTDTAAISFALSLIPDANTDVFVCYFTIILLASITDRTALSLPSPLITRAAPGSSSAPVAAEAVSAPLPARASAA